MRSPKRTPRKIAALRGLLESLCQTVEATGGVFVDGKGFWAPVADPDWIDLGAVYTDACTALGRPIKEGEDPR